MNFFSVGEVLGSSLRIWFRNLLPFTVLATLVHLPLFIYTQVGIDLEDLNLTKLALTGSIMAIAQILLGVFLTATIIYGVVMELRGQHASFMASISVGLKRALPALMITFLMFLVFGLIAVVLVAIGGASQSVALVLLFALVAGIIVLRLYCRWYVAVPASVVERPGIMGAFSRSTTLTDGQKASIFGMIFLVAVVSFGINKIVEMQFDSDTPSEILRNWKTQMFAQLVVDAILSPFGAILPAVTYVALRREKEGVVADDLAQVFE